MLIEFFSRSVHSLSANGARSAGTSGYSTSTVTVLQMMMAVLGSAFTFVSSTFTSFGPDSISPIDSDAMKCLSRLREREISLFQWEMRSFDFKPFTSQRVSCSRFWTWDVAAGADMPDGLMLLPLAPDAWWWCDDERNVRETRSRRSNSWTKCTSKSDDRSVMPHTGQHDGSSGDFFRPIQIEWKFIFLLYIYFFSILVTLLAARWQI